MSSALRSGQAHPYARTASVILLVLTMLASAACARSNTTGAAQATTRAPSSRAPSSRAPASQPVTPPGSTPPRSGPTATSPKPVQRPSVADQLAAFFSGAQRMDRQIRDAATMLNNRVRGNAIQVDAATRTALRAIDPEALVRTIPAGLPSPVQQSVLLVYSELMARRYAFVPIEDAQVGTSLPIEQGVQRCLAGGASPAARFARDLAATRSAAASLPRVKVPAPNSRAWAELALRIQLIGMGNRGCGSCGGWVQATPVPLTWKSGGDGDGHYDGTIRDIPFTAVYSAAGGWHVSIHAC